VAVVSVETEKPIGWTDLSRFATPPERPEPYGRQLAAVLLSESIHVGLVKIDPSRNVARGGRWLGLEHPLVRRQAADVAARGLLEPVGLCLLPAPVPRPCGGPCCADERLAAERAAGDSPPAHLLEVRYGFVRLSALLSLGRDSLRLAQPSVEATVHEAMTDEEAEDACLAENLVRSDPSDRDLAVRFLALSRRAEYREVRSPYERARLLAERFRVQVSYVDSLIRIAERCPQDLLDEWESCSTDEERLVLDRVSRVDLEGLLPEQERHERMRRERDRVRAEAEEARQQKERRRRERAEAEAHGGGSGTAGTRARLSRAAAERTLGRLELAREVYDESSGGYVPMSPEGKVAARAVLRYVLSGGTRGTEPVR
jgi:hypothetical protein